MNLNPSELLPRWSLSKGAEWHTRGELEPLNPSFTGQLERRAGRTIGSASNLIIDDSNGWSCDRAEVAGHFRRRDTFCVDFSAQTLPSGFPLSHGTKGRDERNQRKIHTSQRWSTRRKIIVTHARATVRLSPSPVYRSQRCEPCACEKYGIQGGRVSPGTPRTSFYYYRRAASFEQLGDKWSSVFLSLFRGEGETRPLFLSASLASTNRSSPSVYNIYIYIYFSLSHSLNLTLFGTLAHSHAHILSLPLSLSRTRYRLSGNTRKVYNICISRYMVESRFAKIVSAFSRRGGGRSVSPTFSLHFFFKQPSVRPRAKLFFRDVCLSRVDHPLVKISPLN